jgi:hypothetical protein
MGEGRGKKLSTEYLKRHGGQTFFQAGPKVTGAASSNNPKEDPKGDVQGAVKYLTKTEKGGVLLPDDIV